MSNSDNYHQLTRTFQRLPCFSHLSTIASWDTFTMMSPGGSKARDEALTELSVPEHQLLTDPRVVVWIAAAQQEGLNDVEQANLRGMSRLHHQASLLPESLVEVKSPAGSRYEHTWRSQRPAGNQEGFSDNLKEVVRYSREEARLRAEAKGRSPYDALLDIFEPGMTSAQLDVLLADVESWLSDLLNKVVAKQLQQSFIALVGPFLTAVQRELGLETMIQLGLDLIASRLNINAHPLCGGVSEDVRTTTRYDENELLSALLSVIHETSHACYEQDPPRSWSGQPIILARSTTTHKSRSLFFKTQLGRGKASLMRLIPVITRHFGDQAAFEESNFIVQSQQVKPGFIRTDVDEISYPVHVILRYEIECALINGDTEVDNIPALWSKKMQAWLGLSAIGNYRNGCTQGIHWTDSDFGYFPSYTLGAVYAVQLFSAVDRALPDLNQSTAQGEFDALFDRLHQNIWQCGNRSTTEQFITQATGEPLSSHYFRSHLKARYL